MSYVTAIRRSDTLTVAEGERRADALIAALSPRSWQKISASAGAHGPRKYGWARVAVAALEQRMQGAGLDLHPDKTRIIYCEDSRRRKPWDGPVSSGFLGYAFRPRDTMGKNGRFTGSGLAVSPKAVKRMNQAVTGWRLHRRTDLTWEQLAGWIVPVIRGWMACYGRFRRSVLDPLLARIKPAVRRE